MSEGDLELLITLDDPGQDTLEADAFHGANIDSKLGKGCEEIVNSSGEVRQERARQ